MPWFRIFLFLHLAAVIIGMGTAIFLHLQSMRRSLRFAVLRHLFFFGSRVIWLALLGAAATGVGLLLIARHAPPDIFGVKLALVALLVADGLFIDRKLYPVLRQLRDDQTIRDLPPKELAHLYQSGAVSFIAWWGALAIAVVG